MILTDEVADRVHRMSVAVLRLTAQGVFKVRSDAAEADLGTGYALYAGEGSPLTQVIGFAHRTPGDPAELEAFFAPRGANWEVTVTPFTEPETFRALLNAGYRPGQFEASLAQRIGDVPEPSVEILELRDDLALFQETTWRGWTENEGDAFVPDDLVRSVSAMAARRYLALVDGKPAATASLIELEDGVILGGAATRVPFRGHGLQAALLARRLRDAGKGRFALMGAMPGTSSYRNAQRAGFTPLYSTLVLTRRQPA